MFKINKTKIFQDINRIKQRLKEIVENAKTDFLTSGGRLTKKLAQEYVDDVRKAIITQNFPVSYQILTPKYEARKRVIVPASASKFWIFEGNLLRSLITQRIPQGWFAGVPAGLTGVTDKRMFPVATYATINEERRPLFGPIADDFKNNKVPNILAQHAKGYGTIWGKK